MATNRKFTAKVEVLIIGIFFISFIIWAVSKCSSAKTEYKARAALEAYEDSLATAQEQPLDQPATTPQPAASPAVQAPSQVIREKTTPLYVTIEGLKLRDTPNLNGKVLAELKLYEEVNFLNEVTDSTYEINLGAITANEPWVKVQGRGHAGWVYGAGVDYYKRKLKGAY